MQDFEELQATWTREKQEDMYSINHEVLRQRIQQKMISADRFSDLVEKFILAINLIGASGILAFTILKEKGEWPTYAVILTLCALAGYVIYVRRQRLRESGTFDRSLTGNLEQAISDTRHRVRISRMGLYYLPVLAVFCIFQMWSEGSSIWRLGLISLLFLVAFIAGKWEHRTWHSGRLRNLVRLREEMEENDS